MNNRAERAEAAATDRSKDIEDLVRWLRDTDLAIAESILQTATTAEATTAIMNMVTHLDPSRIAAQPVAGRSTACCVAGHWYDAVATHVVIGDAFDDVALHQQVLSIAVRVPWKSETLPLYRQRHCTGAERCESAGAVGREVVG